MKQAFRALILAALVASPAAAQQFPVISDHSVIGRIGIGGSSGPSQAIPFSLLSQSILTGLCQTNNAFPVYSVSSAAWVCSTAPAANTVYAGPSTGAAAQPTFRALVNADLPAATGTGLLVLQTSPTLTTPTINSPTLTTPNIGVATATSVNKVAITAPATSATLTIPDGVTLTGPAASGTAMTLGNNETVTGVKTFGAAGNVGKLVVAGTTSGSTILNATAVASGTLTLPATTDTLVGKATTDTLTNKTLNSTGTGNVLQVSGVTVSSGQYPGETSTGSATAGNVGEYIESVVASGSALTLVSGTAKTITSISLTAGDWDISGNIQFNTAAATSVTLLESSLSATTNTRDITSGKDNLLFMNATVPTLSTPAWTLPVGPWRLSISGTTSYFLVALAVFTSTAPTANGLIRARRVR